MLEGVPLIAKVAGAIPKRGLHEEGVGVIGDGVRLGLLLEPPGGLGVEQRERLGLFPARRPRTAEA